VVAVDNEQYVAWIRRRFGIHLEPGAGFRAIAELLRSRVDYRRLDALDVERLGRTFDVILCFGVLHRVEAPLTLVRVLGECLAPPGGSSSRPMAWLGGQDDPCVLVHEHGDVYARDDTVYWGFSRSSLDRLGRLAGLRGFALVDAPEIACHPRGSSARSRRADQAARSRRSASSAASWCGRSVVSASGACASACSAIAAWLTVPVVTLRPASRSAATSGLAE
jgi:SAM-dependent methyltransferase